MNKYDSYKDSEIQWIEKIPTSWDMRKLKFLGTVYGGLTGKKGDDFGAEDNPKNKKYIPYTNISNNIFISKDHFDFVILEKDEKQNLVKKNDLFVLMSSENYEDLGKTSILVDDYEELYLNSFCKGFRTTKENMNPIFINYQLQGHLHRKLISVEGNGFTRINLQQNRLLNIPILTTSLTEQDQIVSYLDTKTSLIDSLIKRTQLKIELLKQNRNSTIDKVVTKGLNPKVKMKESGVEWIGEIPVHWRISKLKYLVFDNQESLSNSTNPDLDLDYIEISDVNSNGDINNPTKYIFSESPSRCRRVCRKGDVIISTVRTYLKSIGIIEEQKENLICSTGFSVLTPKSDHLSKYIFYMLRSNWFISKIISKSEGVSYPSIQSHKLLGTEVVITDKQEQQKIVEYLDREIQRINNSILVEEKKIDLLKEYKQSLISEVVLGKKKVVS